MLEALVNPKKGERKPWQLFFVGLLYAALSLAIANWIFADNSVFSKHISIISVFFTVMFSIPFMYYTFLYEEKKDTSMQGERKLMKEHSRAIVAFVFLFLGFVVAFSLAYLVFPARVEHNFLTQIETYCQINTRTHENFNECVGTYVPDYEEEAEIITGKFAVGNLEVLKNIFFNNLYVMILTLVFSLFFGAGAIFILAWNASVIGAAIGIFSQELGGLHGLPSGFLRFLFHGIPEITAYFVGGLAGGIIGFAIIKHDLEKDRFNRILKDFALLLILGVVILVIAALLEVYVTPIFF